MSGYSLACSPSSFASHPLTGYKINNWINVTGCCACDSDVGFPWKLLFPLRQSLLWVGVFFSGFENSVARCFDSFQMNSLLLIPNILPGMLKWTCKIMVIEKQNARISKNTPPKLYRPMVLQDAAGNKVQAMTYGEEIELFGQKMDLYGTYLVSGAVVKASRDAARVPDPNYPNIWTLTRSTYLQNVQPSDAFAHDLAPKCDLTPITAVYDFVGSNKLLNLVAVVIYKFPRQWISSKDRNIPAAEFLIVDEGCVPFILTLWETFSTVQAIQIESELRKGNHPTILIKNVSCTVFQGLKIGTKYSSSFEISPIGDRAAALEHWKALHLDAIHTMIREKAHLSSLVQIAKPLTQPHLKAIDLAHVYALDKVFWMEGHISLPAHDSVQPFVGCNLCGNKVNATEGQQLDCNYCGQPNGMTKKCHKLSVSIYDDTGSASCLMFPDEVDKLLSIVKVTLTDSELDIKVLAEKLTPITFVVELKKSTKDDGGRFYHSFVVACLEQLEQLMVDAQSHGEHQQPPMHLVTVDKTPTSAPAFSALTFAKATVLGGGQSSSSSAPLRTPGAKKKIDFEVTTPDTTVMFSDAKEVDHATDEHSDSGASPLKGSKRSKLG